MLGLRLAYVEALLRELAGQGRYTMQLDQAIEGLKSAAGLKSLSDDRASKLLQPQLDALKSYEFQLSRSIAGEKDGVRVGRVGDVLPSYRALVDEYYRAIGKTPPKNRPPA